MRTLVIAWFVAIVTATSAGETPISKEEIGALFAFPGERVQIVDRTIERNKRSREKGRPFVISAHSFNSDDHGLAPISVTVAEAGTLLSAETKSRIADLVARGAAPKGLRVVELPGGGSGFVGLGLVGPGGAEEKIIVTLCHLGRDLEVSIFVPGDGQLASVPGSERHHALVRDRERLLNALVATAETAAKNVRNVPVELVSPRKEK